MLPRDRRDRRLEVPLGRRGRGPGGERRAERGGGRCEEPRKATGLPSWCRTMLSSITFLLSGVLRLPTCPLPRVDRQRASSRCSCPRDLVARCLPAAASPNSTDRPSPAEPQAVARTVPAAARSRRAASGDSTRSARSRPAAPALDDHAVAVHRQPLPVVGAPLDAGERDRQHRHLDDRLRQHRPRAGRDEPGRQQRGSPTRAAPKTVQRRPGSERIVAPCDDAQLRIGDERGRWSDRHGSDVVIQQCRRRGPWSSSAPDRPGAYHAKPQNVSTDRRRRRPRRRGRHEGGAAPARGGEPSAASAPSARARRPARSASSGAPRRAAIAATLSSAQRIAGSMRVGDPAGERARRARGSPSADSSAWLRQPRRTPTTSSDRQRRARRNVEHVAALVERHQHAARAFDDDHVGARGERADAVRDHAEVDRAAGARRGDVRRDRRVERVRIDARASGASTPAAPTSAATSALTAAPALDARRDRLHRRPRGSRRARARAAARRRRAVLPTPVSVPVTNSARAIAPAQRRGGRGMLTIAWPSARAARLALPRVAVDDLERRRNAAVARAAARAPRAARCQRPRPGQAARPAARRVGRADRLQLAQQRVAARRRSASAAPCPSPDRRSPAPTSMSPRSCMSTKRLMCVWPSTRANARAQLLQRVGAERREHEEAADRAARAANSANARGRSSTHCSARLLQTRSTRRRASGSAFEVGADEARLASRGLRSTGAEQAPQQRARRSARARAPRASIGSARSSADQIARRG